MTNSWKSTCVVALSLALVAGAARAQGQDTSPPPPPPPQDGWAPPPMVDAPDVPRAPPDVSPTPPPPSSQPPPGTQPSASGYPYSPYGVPRGPTEKPRPEIGLMIAEGAFGMLTAAGITLLPYLLLLAPLQSDVQPASGVNIADLMRVLVFGTVPLAVAQTVLSQANSSRYYLAESWPVSLSGLGAEALIFGLYYLVRGGTVATDPAADYVLLIGSIVFVPLVEVVVVNLVKEPRYKVVGPYGGLLDYRPGQGLTAGIPLPAPMVTTRAGRGYSLGASVSLLSGRF